jgi:hypothetical protein
MACIFDLKETMPIPASTSGRRHRAHAVVLVQGLAGFCGAVPPAPTIDSGNSWRWYTGRFERGT